MQQIETFFHPAVTQFLPLIDCISFKMVFPKFPIPTLDILERIISLKVGKVCKEILFKLYETDSWLSGSFLLQCLLSSTTELIKWDSDIDIFTHLSDLEECESCNSFIGLCSSKIGMKLCATLGEKAGNF
jgi:hypothetical protein